MKSLIVADVSQRSARPFPKLMKSGLSEIVYLVSKKNDGQYHAILLSNPEVHNKDPVGSEFDFVPQVVNENFYDFVGIIQLMND